LLSRGAAADDDHLERTGTLPLVVIRKNKYWWIEGGAKYGIR